MKIGWILHFGLLRDRHFMWLEALTMLTNNRINIFLINPNSFIYYFYSLNFMNV